jgi:hypothetical protein
MRRQKSAETTASLGRQGVRAANGPTLGLPLDAELTAVRVQIRYLSCLSMAGDVVQATSLRGRSAGVALPALTRLGNDRDLPWI